MDSASHFAAALESVSQAEIGLDKVVVSLPTGMINEVISGLAEHSDMGSKAVFQSTADGPERPTLDAPRYAVEPRVELRKLSVYGLPTPASEKTTEPADPVGRQVNTWPEVIQREPQYDLSRYNTRRRTDRTSSARRPDSVDAVERLSHSEIPS